VAAKQDLQKKVDLPPRGGRNADPITDEPGSHPIETGIGAAAGGAVTGMAGGAIGGPVSAVLGAAVGAVAGGYVGKSIGEVIDPTTDDNWLRDNFDSRPYVVEGDRFEDFEPAYRYGAAAESVYGDAGFDSMHGDLEREWETNYASEMPWGRARQAVKDGYERTVQIRKHEGTCRTPGDSQ
jgi:hypothetical protein